MVYPSYLAFVSMVLLPLDLLMLVLLTTGIARKQVYMLIKYTTQLGFNVNGVQIKFFPMFAVISAMQMGFLYQTMITIQTE